MEVRQDVGRRAAFRQGRERRRRHSSIETAFAAAALAAAQAGWQGARHAIADRTLTAFYAARIGELERDPPSGRRRETIRRSRHGL